MFCPECGNEISASSKFCCNCGASNPRYMAPDSSKTRPHVEMPVEKEAKTLVSRDRGTEPGINVSLASKNSATVPLAVMDGVLLALTTLVSWIGSTYVSGTKSLPGIAFDGFRIISELSEYRSYAYSYGAGDAYSSVMGLLLLVAIAAAIGCASATYCLVKNLMSDLKGEAIKESDGGIVLAVVASLVIVVVKIGCAYISSVLKNQYYDLSYFGRDAVTVTGFVWISLIAGIAVHYFRQNTYQQHGIKVVAKAHVSGKIPSDTKFQYGVENPQRPDIEGMSTFPGDSSGFYKTDDTQHDQKA